MSGKIEGHSESTPLIRKTSESKEANKNSNVGLNVLKSIFKKDETESRKIRASSAETGSTSKTSSVGESLSTSSTSSTASSVLPEEEFRAKTERQFLNLIQRFDPRITSVVDEKIASTIDAKMKEFKLLDKAPSLKEGIEYARMDQSKLTDRQKDRQKEIVDDYSHRLLLQCKKLHETLTKLKTTTYENVLKDEFLETIKQFNKNITSLDDEEMITSTIARSKDTFKLMNKDGQGNFIHDSNKNRGVENTHHQFYLQLQRCEDIYKFFKFN